MNSATHIVHKDHTLIAVFDNNIDAHFYADQMGAIVTSVPYNPPIKRLFRVSFTCGALYDSSAEIFTAVDFGDPNRRTHGQMYAGNPGVWVVYVEAENPEEAKVQAKEIAIEALRKA
jgi:hypothetical protein